MHPNIAEAQKRLEAAKAAYGASVASINAQYLKSLVGGGSKADIAAVNKLRASFLDVSDVATFDPAAALEQPADAPAPKARKK